MATERLIRLREWQPTELTLDGEELAELQALPAKLSIQPVSGRYVVTPTSIIGSATTTSLQVVIEPKLDIDRVFFLLGYARKIPLRADTTVLAQREGVVEPFVAAFLDTLQRALRRGLPMGYVGREEASTAIRGRVRFGDQLKRRYELPLPVEVSYDDHTVDTEANRLVKSALQRVRRLRLRNANLRRRAAEALAAFEGVDDVAFDPRRLPTFTYTRLNERYRPVVELAVLLVQNSSVELHPGASTSSSVLFDMNDVFEDFVFEAIGDELRVLLPASYRWRHGKSVSLDEDGSVRPEPDLSLWDGGSCVFVGDAKYKETAQGEVGDLYQLLAYCSATGLPEGLLLYAEKPSGPSYHRVVRGGPSLRVETIDVTAPVSELRERCRTVAAEISSMATAAAAA